MIAGPAGNGRRFVKMSGSGNDFVMFDAREEPAGDLARPEMLGAICARGTGVGADGVVFLERSAVADIRLVYYNADGSLADLCGNATLCTTRLAVELGAGDARGLVIETGAGLIQARITDGGPEIDLQPIRDLAPDRQVGDLGAGESRMGFARAGVPHLAIVVDDIEAVDVVGRGRPLRHHPTLADGANVNFLAEGPRGWRMRTYERGVEGETLACGTGAVASAALLSSWGLASSPVTIRTRSGRALVVRFRHEGGRRYPSLSGEGRIVFSGHLGELGEDRR
jgi:diaminopimelate epimerase